MCTHELRRQYLRPACSPAVVLAGMPADKGLSAAWTRAVLSCDDILQPEGMTQDVGYTCPLSAQHLKVHALLLLLFGTEWDSRVLDTPAFY